ncbi:uncharacterized protein I303_107066 [Kwoniella dejecticola CBS 10117]|uniref:Uncharacterized protein n=1 Tax=Kwoniella dejecticola CBS 10117 TaxID=1296121 RepID=A0A1A5ZYM8_9TREE|nr:uncharacterized protein I303_06467 [Kwoniella dejecticola CBS 10117]OBR82909.1 hypothetical protein I303_06467 [Kwoniella dejecticola CBS 10117]
MSNSIHHPHSSSDYSSSDDPVHFQLEISDVRKFGVSGHTFVTFNSVTPTARANAIDYSGARTRLTNQLASWPDYVMMPAKTKGGVSEYQLAPYDPTRSRKSSQADTYETILCDRELGREILKQSGFPDPKTVIGAVFGCPSMMTTWGARPYAESEAIMSGIMTPSTDMLAGMATPRPGIGRQRPVSPYASTTCGKASFKCNILKLGQARFDDFICYKVMSTDKPEQPDSAFWDNTDSETLLQNLVKGRIMRFATRKGETVVEDGKVPIELAEVKGEHSDDPDEANSAQYDLSIDAASAEQMHSTKHQNSRCTITFYYDERDEVPLFQPLSQTLMQHLGSSYGNAGSSGGQFPS